MNQKVRISIDQRRARLGSRHALAAPVGSIEEAADAVVGLHSSDPVTVFLSAWARVDGLTVTDVEEALYERRSLLRMLGMRRTMFVQTEPVAEVMDAACTRALGPPQRRSLIKLLEGGGVEDDIGVDEKEPPARRFSHTL